MNDHCGYHFPLHFSPEFHDFHHLKSVPETSNHPHSPTHTVYKYTPIAEWKLGFYPQNRFHTSYGWFGIWDWIHGTDDKFDKSTTHRWHFSCHAMLCHAIFTTNGLSYFHPRFRSRLRHFRLMSGKAAREHFPDVKQEWFMIRLLQHFDLKIL